MPGSGPTDPEIVIHLIKSGDATWHDGHLVVRGVAMWLDIDRTSDEWITTTARAICLSEETFLLLRSSRVVDKIVAVPGEHGGFFTLAAPLADEVPFATLMPAA
jgi:hypothetical protein